MKYKTCTEYWLDPDTRTFRGEFEAMYRDIPDPWGCQEASDSLSKRIFLEMLFDRRTFRAILDLGCGLGGFTNRLYVRNGGGEVVGLDISSTAIERASRCYPHIAFSVKNLLMDEIGHQRFDLVVFSEGLWYVLEGIDSVFMKIERAMTAGGLVGIHQYFPDRQKFGGSVVGGLEGFERYLANKTGLRFRNKVLSYGQEEGRVLLAILERRC